MSKKYDTLTYTAAKRKVSEITPNPDNPRTITKETLKGLKRSMETNGYADRIIIEKNGQILSGHARWLLFKQQNPDQEIDVLVCDQDLTPDQRRRALVELNAQGGEINIEEFQMKFGDIAEEYGFRIDMPDPDDTKEVEEVDLPDEDKIEPRAKYGDIYQLGDHRLMCGSATDPNDVDKLMDGKQADLVVTDPPYNMNYTGAGNTEKTKRKGIMNDNMPEEEFKAFLTDSYRCMNRAMKLGASCYVFYKEMGHDTFITAMEDAGLLYKQELIWVKNQLVLGGSKYQSIYEPFLYGIKAGGEITWNGGRKQTAVLEQIDLMPVEEVRKAYKALQDSINGDILREDKTKKNDLHPTMKSIKLLARLIRNSSNKGEIVLDLFGGSGSTLMACEQTGRTCYTTELDPQYVDVIIARWEQYTGKKATKIN